MLRKTYTFWCPVCSKTFRIDGPGEPCCTGPNETLDEHPLTVMHLQRVGQREVHPERAADRSAGPLILA